MRRSLRQALLAATMLSALAGAASQTGFAQTAPANAPLIPATSPAPNNAASDNPAPGPQAAQEKVGVETGLHDGYARIVFAWPAAVDYEAHIAGNILIVKFARPLSADLTRIPRQIDSYAESAAMEGNDTVRVTLKHEYGLRKFVEGQRIAIDLLDGTKSAEPKTGAPPPAAADKAAPADKTPAPPNTTATAADSPAAASPASPSLTSKPPLEITATLIDQDGVRRVIFNSPKRVGYSTSKEKGELRVRFRAPAEMKLEPLAGAAPELAPKLLPDTQGVTVALNLPPGSRYHTSQVGNDIIVEITPPAKPTAPPAVRAAEKPADSKQPQPAPSGTKTANVKSDGAKPADDVKTGETQPPSAPAAIDKLALNSAANPAAGPSASRDPDGSNEPADSQNPGIPASAAAPPDAASLPLRYDRGDEGATLRFEWKKPVPAAVFRRGAYLWIVFGAPLAVDLADLQAKGQAAISAVQQVPHSAATILRLTTLKGFNPSIRKSENAWIVELQPQLLQPEGPIGVSLQPAAAPPRMVFTVHGQGQPVVFRDPEIGDNLIVVPVGDVGQGVAREEKLVDVTALLTVQGIALRPANDQIVTHDVANGVEVSAPGGLVLSDDSDRALRRNEAQARLFDFADWYGPENGDFLAQRRALESSIVDAAPVSRSGARLDLARFYFAHGLGAEASGVLQVIAHDDPNFAADPRVRALDGAVMLLEGDSDGAARELGLHPLDDEQDVALWRGSLAFEKRDWATAAKEFSRGEPLLASYPKRLRNRLAFQAAEASLGTGQQEEATHYLDLVKNDAPSPAERANLQLLSARALQLAGEGDHAHDLLDRLVNSEDRPTRARAMLARTMADLDSGAITLGQAIQSLDGLRFAWRGDEFELSLLRKLGELKLQDHDYRGGLEALRQAATNFPDHPEHNAITQQLTSVFTDVLIGADSTDVPPLRALALYDEFKDLTPAGAKGDEIIQRLADRLVAVDLLDRAAGLLDDQVKFRLAGRDKARVATRLAIVRLLDRKPQDALAALDTDVGHDIDPDLLRQRQQLRARALLELGRSDEALTILASDNTRDADRLRADIAWQMKRWPDAAKIFERLAPNETKPGTLSEDDARIVLNWGTAETLAGQDDALEKLADRYGAAMDASPYRDAFRVLTGAGVPSEGDIRTIADKVAQLGDLQNFMTQYRQRLSNEKLSAIN